MKDSHISTFNAFSYRTEYFKNSPFYLYMPLMNRINLVQTFVALVVIIMLYIFIYVHSIHIYYIYTYIYIIYIYIYIYTYIYVYILLICFSMHC